MKHILLLTLIVLIDSSIGYGQSQYSNSDALVLSVEEVRQKLESIQNEYTVEFIQPSSDQYKLFHYLENNPEVAVKVIPELIEATTVRSPRPNTTERSSPLSVAPAGGILVMLGGAADEAVKAKLLESVLKTGQREVLEEVIRVRGLAESLNSGTSTDVGKPPIYLPPPSVPIGAADKALSILTSRRVSSDVERSFPENEDETPITPVNNREIASETKQEAREHSIIQRQPQKNSWAEADTKVSSLNRWLFIFGACVFVLIISIFYYRK